MVKNNNIILKISAAQAHKIKYYNFMSLSLFNFGPLIRNVKLILIRSILTNDPEKLEEIALQKEADWKHTVAVKVHDLNENCGAFNHKRFEHKRRPHLKLIIIVIQFFMSLLKLRLLLRKNTFVI